MEDNGISDKEFLVARGHKRSEKVHRRMWHMPKEQNWTEVPTGKLMPNTVPEKPWTHISGFYYKITTSSRIQQYIGSM